jgi:anti-sigma factor RsiW
MIACADLEEFVANYLDGSLPRSERRELERHLDECKTCREFLAAYRRTVWVAKMASRSMSNHTPEELVQSILGSLGRRSW